MSTLAEIKTAAASLSVEEQMELSDWIQKSDAIRALQLDELRKELQVGVDAAERGDLHEAEEVFAPLRKELGI